MSKKMKINNKPVPKEERVRQQKNKKHKEKFGDISLDALMDYIEALEERIEALEGKTK